MFCKCLARAFLPDGYTPRVDLYVRAICYHFEFSKHLHTTKYNMSKTTNHMYEGQDAKYHGPQALQIPGPAMDDVFQHIYVEDYQPDSHYLIIRRMEDKVLLMPQKRTCGHVRVLHEEDGPVPDILDILDNESAGQKVASPGDSITEPRTPQDANPKQSTTSMKTPPADGEYATYASFVANIDLAGNARCPLRGVEPRVTRWGVVIESPGLRAFEGYDDRPLRQLAGNKTVHQNNDESPPGRVIKIAAPGTLWTLPIAGGILRFCCLHGFQVRSGPFWTLGVRAQYVESVIDKELTTPLDMDVYFKIKVDDLFSNGLPQPKFNKMTKFTGERLASHFVEHVTKWKEWSSVKTIVSAPYQQRLQETAQRHAEKLALAQKVSDEKKEEKKRRNMLAMKAQQAMARRKAEQQRARQQKRREALQAAKKAAQQEKKMKATIQNAATAAAKSVASKAQQQQRSALAALEQKMTLHHEKIVAKMLQRFEKENIKEKENAQTAIKEQQQLVTEVYTLRETVRTLRAQLHAADQRLYRISEVPSPVRRHRSAVTYLSPPPEPHRRRVEYDLGRVTYTGSAPVSDHQQGEHRSPVFYRQHREPISRREHREPVSRRQRREPVSRRLTYGESPPSYRARYAPASAHYDHDYYSHRR